MIGVERVPSGDSGRAFRQLGICRYDALHFLFFKNDLAHLVPADIELPFEFCDPVLWRVMGRVRSRWRNRSAKVCPAQPMWHPDPRDGI
jgi:hypothetical protein